MVSTERRSKARKILSTGRNCWTADAAVQSCSLLIDGREYYRTFYRAARKAERYILIAGWKFGSEIRLLRGPDVAEARGEVRLVPFLKELCREKPQLRIYVLAWNYSLLYALKWEWFLPQKFNEPHGRLKFCFDNQHAIGASHHQKFVVIDGHTAFVGGLDFNGDDWDDRDHKLENPDRVDHGDGPDNPYHDIQACLIGPAAQELALYFRQRWQAAGNAPLELPAPVATTPEKCPGMPIQTRRVALSRSQPATLTNAESVVEIRELYDDALTAAQELIYIENQYFTAHTIGETLARRMRDTSRPRLDIVVIVPKRFPGWLERLSLEPPRLRLLQLLSDVARETGHRLGVYYSAGVNKHGAEVATLIHSKVLIVDDRFLTAGSANTSNRSMGLDTELNVSWEALTPRDHELAESIQRIRVSLLAEHCGLRGQPDAQRTLQGRAGLVTYLDHLADTRRAHLRHFTRDTILHDNKWLERLARWGFSLDPDRPIIDELV